MDNEHNSQTVTLRDYLLSSADRIDNYTVNNETFQRGGKLTNPLPSRICWAIS